MSEAIEELPAVGSFLMSRWQLVLLSEAQAELGAQEAAEATIARALDEQEQISEPGGAGSPPHWRRVILRKPGGDLRVAEERLRQAIEIAGNQRAKWWELRATKSLAKLLRDTGRRDEARTILLDVCNWFTEGFDTADLKDAKALLKKLS